MNDWHDVAAETDIPQGDVIGRIAADRQIAIFRLSDGLFATDAICTHGNAHLADGLVMGNLIECAKHNGRFDLRDGSPQRPPVCVALKSYPVREKDDHLQLNLKPVMTLSSKIIATQELKSGDRVGYHGLFEADYPMRIGIVACGYADGYPRHPLRHYLPLGRDARTGPGVRVQPGFGRGPRRRGHHPPSGKAWTANRVRH